MRRRAIIPADFFEWGQEIEVWTLLPRRERQGFATRAREPAQLPERVAPVNAEAVESPRFGENAEDVFVQPRTAGKIIEGGKRRGPARSENDLPVPFPDALHVAKSHTHGEAAGAFRAAFHRTVPIAALQIDGKNDNAVALGVLNDGGRRVKSHGLGVE